jgi:NhaA family Na+:H+ antiporter
MRHSRSGDDLSRLPGEPIDRFTKPFAEFLRIEASTGAVLLLFTFFAVCFANSPWSAAFFEFWETPVGIRVGSVEISRSLKLWINDGLMTFVFFVVALELKRELILGELRHPRMAALSCAAAIGGMVVPAGLYLFLMSGTPAVHGWGSVMATDTAFVIGCLAILGRRVPLSLRLFLLSLAIFDDIGAILVVALGYGGMLSWPAAALAGFAAAIAAAMARLGVRSIPAYMIVGGLAWLALDASGIHPTVTGVALGLMTPARAWVSDRRLHAILNRIVAQPPGDHWSGDTNNRRDLQRARIATREALSPIERLEIMLHPWVAFAVVPLFALANAGVPISPMEFQADVAMAVFLGFVIGKPIGVVLFSFLAVQLGLAIRPPSLDWRLLCAGSLLTGIGFTMAFFIAELAFSPDLLNTAKLGIFGASIVSGCCGLLALLWLTRNGHARSAIESSRGVISSHSGKSII